MPKDDETVSGDAKEAEGLPGPVIVSAGEPVDLPDLPPGFKWGVTITAEAEVIGPDGKVKKKP